MIHELKTVNPYFNDVNMGIKTFEIRNKSDRNFNVGDVMILKEWEMSGLKYNNCCGK